jgi:hypothetical protein
MLYYPRDMDRCHELAVNYEAGANKLKYDIQMEHGAM